MTCCHFGASQALPIFLQLIGADSHCGLNLDALARLGESKAPPPEDCTGDPSLRSCQTDCLSECVKGARIIEMACGTGKTRVIKELVNNISGKVPCLLYWGMEVVGALKKLRC